MSYPLGAPIRLTWTSKDAGGTPTTGTPTLTITKPDGTQDVLAGGSIADGGTGVYTADYTPTLAGRHILRWTASGAVVAASAPDVFEVDTTDRAPLVSLAEIKRHLNLPASRITDDDELLYLASGVTDAVESHLGRPLRRTVVTDVFSHGSGPLILRKVPCPCVVCAPHRLLSITTMTEDGNPLTGYTLDSARGLLFRDNFGSGWSTLTLQNLTVVYEAGYVTTPPWARQAVLRAIEGLWQGSQQAPHPALGQDATGAPDWAVAQSYMLPYAVQSILNPHRSAGF